MKLSIAISLVFALLAGCTPAAQQTQPANGSGQTAGATAGTRQNTTIPHTLRIGDIEDITTLNPHLGTVISLGYMSSLTMAYLVRYGPDNRPLPELATAVPSVRNHLISADGLQITWHLRRGVKWSDGVPFDADDVVFSTNAVNNLKNNELGRDGWELIRKIDEPDKYTVIYHLKKRYSAFLPTFFGTAGANPCIIPKHILGKLPNINNAPYNSKPIGIGPFRYVEWVRNDHVTMEANPYYWRGVPKLQKIIYKFIPDRNTLLTQMQTGEIDMWPLVGLGFYQRVKALPNVKTIVSTGYSFSHLDFNNSRPIFKDKAVREALRYATDRSTLREKIQHGLGILQEGPITPVSPLYTPFPPIAFDIGKANALLDAAGWKRGADGVRVKGGQRLALDFAVGSGQPDADQEIELIRTTWQQIGAQINLHHYPITLMFAPYQDGGIMFTSKFDVIFFSWQLTPDGDLTAEYGCDQMPPAGENDLRYCDRKTQAYLDAAKATYDEADRKPILAAAQRQIIADVPSIVLWMRQDIFTYNKDLKNWKPNNTTPFDSMLDVDI